MIPTLGPDHHIDHHTDHHTDHHPDRSLRPDLHVSLPLSLPPTPPRPPSPTLTLTATPHPGDTDHPPPRSSRPSVRVVRIPHEGSFHIVVASDGLWDVVSKDEVPTLLAEAHSGADAAELAATLRDEAHLRGSSDNVSVVVLCARCMHDLVPR